MMEANQLSQDHKIYNFNSKIHPQLYKIRSYICILYVFICICVHAALNIAVLP